MTKRILVKWLHWIAFGLMLYFFFVEPEVSGSGDARGQMLSTHAGMGMILGVVTLIWSVIYFWGGPLGRPGPKLPGSPADYRAGSARGCRTAHFLRGARGRLSLF